MLAVESVSTRIGYDDCFERAIGESIGTDPPNREIILSILTQPDFPEYVDRLRQFTQIDPNDLATVNQALEKIDITSNTIRARVEAVWLESVNNKNIGAAIVYQIKT